MSAHCGVGQKLGEVQQGQNLQVPHAVGDRLCASSTNPGVLWSWHLGTSKTGTSLPDPSVGDTPPSGPPKCALGPANAGYVGYDLFGLLLKQQCSFRSGSLRRHNSTAWKYGQGGGIHRGRVLVLDRRCREQEASVASPGDPRGVRSARTTFGWSPTFWTPSGLPAELAARFYRMRWEATFFQNI